MKKIFLLTAVIFGLLNKVIVHMKYYDSSDASHLYKKKTTNKIIKSTKSINETQIPQITNHKTRHRSFFRIYKRKVRLPKKKSSSNLPQSRLEKSNFLHFSRMKNFDEK